MSTSSLKETAVQPRATYLKFMGLLGLTVLCVFSVYTFLHESGHTLVGLIFGQTLTAFSTTFWDLSAHVQLVGELSAAQQALQSAAGVALPLLVWAIFMSLVPRKASFNLELFKLVASMGVVNTLLVWMVIPLLDLRGNAPVNDDVTHFLRASALPPLLVTAVAGILYILGWVLFMTKSRGLAQFRQLEEMERTGPAAFTMLAVTAVVFLSTFSINMAATQNGTPRLSPPSNLALVAQVDLTARAYQNEVLATFSVTENGRLDMFFSVQDINTNYFDLRLIGPNGYSYPLLHGEVYRADRDGGLRELTLLPGTYQVVLTADQSPGAVSIYGNNAE